MRVGRDGREQARSARYATRAVFAAPVRAVAVRRERGANEASVRGTRCASRLCCGERAHARRRAAGRNAKPAAVQRPDRAPGHARSASAQSASDARRADSSRSCGRKDAREPSRGDGVAWLASRKRMKTSVGAASAAERAVGLAAAGGVAARRGIGAAAARASADGARRARAAASRAAGGGFADEHVIGLRRAAIVRARSRNASATRRNRRRSDSARGRSGRRA
ncbi:hypothetical protein NCM_00561 [Burkholderia pseudomallei]